MPTVQDGQAVCGRMGPSVLGTRLEGCKVPAPEQSCRSLPPGSHGAGMKGLLRGTAFFASGLLLHSCLGGCRFAGQPGAGAGREGELRATPHPGSSPTCSTLSTLIKPVHRHSPSCLTLKPPHSTPRVPTDTYNHIEAGIEAHDLTCRRKEKRDREEAPLRTRVLCK